MRCLQIISMVAAVAAAPVAAEADIYTFDPEHTNVTFSWNHLGLSRQSARIRDVQGLLEFDPVTPEQSRVEATLTVASLSTGVPQLDRDLRSSDFLDAARYPEIVFRSTSVTKTGPRNGEVAGDLTIMGQTHPVVLEVRWNFTGEHPLAEINPVYKNKFVSGFSAVTTISRSQWGLTRGIPLVPDEIEISIEAEFARK